MRVHITIPMMPRTALMRMIPQLSHHCGLKSRGHATLIVSKTIHTAAMKVTGPLQAPIDTGPGTHRFFRRV